MPSVMVFLQVKVEECFWTLEDRKVIIVHLEKVGQFSCCCQLL